ncbi:hypothetical protein ISF_02079 [Cordyceps fumosorosea ARSEF 2679]|uniref:Uncharacterized protein n=1 Tax=Cordyceps fumosorosea (strain ARSEF 2679) TaxID=1081104 RepID=A0A168CLL2_CORFA|nr:hypothetical protein ISF_02079 [Cordyceps fumosorosea ARSEF 2679]OAA71528.1 hypothetical protein ISF_02079 [Cordyceps fumosorosea ARSEF 2679]
MSASPSLVDSVRHHAVGAYSYAQRSLDRVVEPETRLRAYDASYALASTRPLIFSAAATLLFFSALPILLFSVFAVSVATMAVGGGILFALFWLALGVLFLVPTLAVTSLLALLVWAWAAGSFVIARAAYRAVVAWEAGGDGSRGIAASETRAQGFKRPPPVPQVRPEKKTASGNGHDAVPVAKDA